MSGAIAIVSEGEGQRGASYETAEVEIQYFRSKRAIGAAYIWPPRGQKLGYPSRLLLQSEPDVDPAVPRAGAGVLTLGEEPIVAPRGGARMVAAQVVRVIIVADAVVVVPGVVILGTGGLLTVVALALRLGPLVVLVLLIVSGRLLSPEYRGD